MEGAQACGLRRVLAQVVGPLRAWDLSLGPGWRISLAHLHDSYSEGVSTNYQGIFHKLNEGMVILPHQQHLSQNVVYSTPEKLFKDVIIPVRLIEELQNVLYKLL